MTNAASHTHMFHSNKNDSMTQPRTFSVDEFSEFQSAVPSTPANSTTRSTFGLTFDSPVHVHNNPNKSSSFVPPSSATTAAATGNGFSNKDCIGSRLANYDLGTMSPRINQPQPNQSAQFFVPITSCNSTLQGPMLSTTNCTTNGDNLLIGEEDKYSALRGLIDEIPPLSPPVTQHQQQGISSNCTHTPNYVSRVDGNVEHKISLVNDDVLEVVKTETMDKSLDFGEFQSFSSSENTYPSAVTNNNNHINNFSNARIQQNDLFDVNFGIINLNNNAKISSSNAPWLTSEFKGLQIQPSTIATAHLEQNSSSLNDGDFGDFVKATGGESIVPASPKIVLRSELSKKSTAKSKKPAQGGVAKINLSRTLAKASNILIDSPTYPKSFAVNAAEINKSSPLDDGQLSYYQTTNTNHHHSNNNVTVESSSSSSFDLMTSEGFDFGLSSPYTVSGGGGGPPPIQLDKVEFGAPLKTTLIGNSTSDDDDFGDFTTVHQVPIVDPSTQVNNLDLLPFVTKSKLNCPQAAAETQSIASLDLGNYLESGDGKNFMDNDPSPDSSEALEFEPYMKEELSVNNRNPNDVMQSAIQTELGFQVGFPHADEEDHSVSNSEDKYKCFKEEIESERERYSTEWSRCLTSCLQLLTYAQSMLNSVSSSEVIREIISNEKGFAYIQNLIEVYLVASRIHLSWKKLGGGDDIKKLFEEINAAWESLTPYFIGTPIMDSVQESVSKVSDWKEGDYSDCSKVCGVCLGSSMDQNPESLIDYGGKYYHAPCGNFFIHKVDSILPSLCYISML